MCVVACRSFFKINRDSPEAKANQLEWAPKHGQSASLGSAPARLLRPNSAPVPLQGAPGGSGQRSTPRARPAHWAPSHCLGCSSEPPSKPPIPSPLTLQARKQMDMEVPDQTVAGDDIQGREDFVRQACAS